MAYSSKLFLAAITMFAIVTPLANGLTILGQNITTAQIAGRLLCTATGNLISGTNSTGIGGVKVGLNCTVGTGSRNVTQTVTGPTGLFNIVFNALDLVRINPISCVIVVPLPIPNCTALPTNGTLTAIPSLTGVVQTVLGPLATFVATPFRFLFG